ncbi:hypothetical protein BX600DRAFT_509684 [Xylariales sp. PMI_506]|nr:hypothetical protein BX600DRAFT_509684 [Xylariales sp. PMI_506]
MLLVNAPEFPTHAYYVSERMTVSPSTTPIRFIDPFSMTTQRQDRQPAARQPASDNSEVAQALEIARESPDGAKDPTVSCILDGALAQVWKKVEAQPDSYVMSREEFAVFNYFQHRFQGNELATAARKRYWDNTSG